MAVKLVVTANVSVKGVMKIAARAAPAAPSSNDNANPICNSRNNVSFRL